MDWGLLEYRMGKRGPAGWTEVRRMRLQVLGSNVCRLRMLKGHVRGVRGRLGMAGLRELQAAVYGAWVVQKLCKWAGVGDQGATGPTRRVAEVDRGWGPVVGVLGQLL